MLITISLVETAQTPHCSASEDGQKVYEQILKAFKDGNQVKISFEGVEDLTTAFLNTAVGQLYGIFTDEEIKLKLTVVNYEQEDLTILKRVVDRAKEFFKDPSLHNEALKETLGGEDE